MAAHFVRRRSCPRSFGAGRSAEDVRDQIEQTRRFLTALERDLRTSPDRLAMERWNRALILLFKNQLAILEALTEKSGNGRSNERGEVDAAPEESVDSISQEERQDGPTEVDETTAEPENERTEDERAEDETSPIASAPKETITPAPTDDATRAVELFELEKLERWLAQAGGLPFQIRGEFAFVKGDAVTGGRSRETSLSLGHMGYTERVGRIDHTELASVVILFRNPDGGRRSWDDEPVE